ncbi:hypothetical protein SNE40_000923 [Patella caerulea]|uniref:Ig-like domain-containing protein n=1 Tax=Patella caerulea TaxID=87958 RepID=A0AAN8QHI8_PATCE
MADQQAQWAKFFDGDVIRQYQEFVKSKEGPPVPTSRPTDVKDELPISVKPVPGHTHVSSPQVSTEIYSRFVYPHNPIVDHDKMRRKRRCRTRLCIVMGYLFIGIMTLTASLLIHFLIIENPSRIKAGTKFTNSTDIGNVTTTPRATTSESTEHVLSTPVPPLVAPPVEVKTSTTRPTRVISTTEATVTSQKPSATPTKSTSKPTAGLPTTTILPTSTAITTTSPKQPAAPVTSTTKPTTGLPPTTALPTTALPTTTSLPTTTALPKTTETIKTRSPASVSLNIISVSVGQTMDLTCNIKDALNWEYITVMHMEVGKLRLLSTLHGATKLAINMPNVTSTVSSVGDDITFNLKERNTECSDHGKYRCRLVFQDASTLYDDAEAVVSKPHVVPEIFIPTTLIENTPVTISANWTLGPADVIEQVTWEIQHTNDTGFIPIAVNDVDHAPVRKNCSTEFTNSFQVTLNSTWNNSILRVTVMSVDDNGVSRSNTSEMVYLLLLPDTVCDGHRNGTNLVPHPEDLCRFYVECTERNIALKECSVLTCFNALEQKCLASSASIFHINDKGVVSSDG